MSRRRILKNVERGRKAGPRLSFMASELLRWLSKTAALVLKRCCLAKKLAKVQNIVEFINDSVLSSDGPSAATQY